jgi:hypothetical protein
MWQVRMAGDRGGPALTSAGADRDGDVIELGHVMKEPMLSIVRDGVSLDKAQVCRDDDSGLGTDPVPDPP